MFFFIVWGFTNYFDAHDYIFIQMTADQKLEITTLRYIVNGLADRLNYGKEWENTPLYYSIMQYIME